MLAGFARAQTAVVSPITLNYWAGGGLGTTNVLSPGSNIVYVTGANGIGTNFLSVGGEPAGVTNVLTVNSCTNSTVLGLSIRLTNIAMGYYPLTITASNLPTTYATNVSLFVVPQWLNTNINSSGLWSDNAQWSGGVVPASTDGVYIEGMADAVFTNVVDSSRTIKSLVYVADRGGNNPDIVTVITNGAVLTVDGTNGIYFGVKATAAQRPTYYFIGGGALILDNSNATFSVNSGSAASSANGPILNMTNLNTFTANVYRFGVGDGGLNNAALIGGEIVHALLAKTNNIKTAFAADYTALDFDCAFQYQCNKNLSSGSLNPTMNLGYTNGIFVDSLAVGRAQGTSGVGLTGGGSTLRFAFAFSNSVSPGATAYFRNTNGAAINLIAVGVDSGPAGSTSLANCKGTIDLRGGTVDILVDKIWLGHNRTNAATPTDAGAFIFDWGNISANTVIAGYNQYTNNATVQGFLVVGTNGTLRVKNYIELGHTPTNSDTVANWPLALVTSGQMQINNGGVARVNQIKVGLFSTNNSIAINAGGTLDVTNVLTDSVKRLTSLNNQGGTNELHMVGTSTLIYVSNLTAGANAKISITSVSAPVVGTPIPVISFVNGTTVNNYGWSGVAPAGYSANVSQDSANVYVTLSLGSPKTLMWKGYSGITTWDTVSQAWLDVATGLHTNFVNGDKVIFDDTAANFNINVTEEVLPAQSGTGVAVTNNSNDYTFTTTGTGKILGGVAMVKQGSKSLNIDLYTELGTTLSQGALTNTAAGTVGSVAADASTTFYNLGSVLGVSSSAGLVLNFGTMNGQMTIGIGGVCTNASTMKSFSVNTNGLLVNNPGASLVTIGSSTVSGGGGTLVNRGAISGVNLTVSGYLNDTGEGTITLSGTLTLNAGAIFTPGGNGVGITTVDGSGVGFPGRILLNQGSTNIFKVAIVSGVSTNYTLLKSGYQDFGGSSSARSQNGCTLVITNTSGSFAAGQSFALFQYNGGGAPSSTGQSTNTYPVIIPQTPGSGLVWDMTQLWPAGVISVITPPVITLTNSFAVSPSNVVADLSWDPALLGYRVQTLAATNSVGLSGTNWVNVAGSWTNISATITNTINANNSVFYRLSFP